MLGPLESLQDQTSRVSQSGLYAVIVDNAFTASECASLVRTAEVRAGGKWEHAMIDVGHGVQELDTTVRSCGRIVCDDQEIAEKIWVRVKDAVPEVEVLKDWPEVTGKWACRLKEVWKMTRLNERLRFLKYGPGEYFRPHCDGLYTTPDCQEASFFTLHLYLNESDLVTPGGKLEGGATTFHGYDFEEMDSWDESGEVQKRLDVVPKMGRVLIFQQRDLLHSGDDVTAGTKLTMRTDLMYKRAEN
ncbi:oxidoreductase domain containing protein [Lasallia pustulata]|uniref:Oxidoreductase domain containing protein n=1 Tax=Lasallia pustulata TaxID=136370 RepID=A0A1W5CT17_9LECA|nr:oxidoreductase domain containing protein [Lasallia pustulata]